MTSAAVRLVGLFPLDAPPTFVVGGIGSKPYRVESALFSEDFAPFMFDCCLLITGPLACGPIGLVTRSTQIVFGGRRCFRLLRLARYEP